ILITKPLPHQQYQLSIQMADLPVTFTTDGLSADNTCLSIHNKTSNVTTLTVSSQSKRHKHVPKSASHITVSTMTTKHRWTRGYA
ncbi:hypothetical protein RRG08_050522, partial [Elysia crispata]